jgi:outer membrane protein assembly factor BamB
MTPLVALTVATFLPAADAPANWPSFRGGAHGGVAEAKTLPDKWSATENVVWKVEVPGRGWSSPVVWGDKVLLTTVETENATGDPKKGLYIDNVQGKVPPGEHRWQVLCLDWKTGKTLWKKEAHKGPAPGPIHVKNTFASETPVTDGQRVYALFGNRGVWCYDLDGKELWKKELAAARTRFGWGPAASPALHRDKLFVVNDNEEKSYLLCLDAKTGKELWKVERDEKSNWATPFVWENKERTEVVTAGTTRVRSYDLDGKLLWELAGMSSITVPTPTAKDGLLYVSSGYVLDSKRPVFAVKPGAEGDITPKASETSNKYVAWVQRQAGAYHPSPVIYGDHVYVLLDRGYLSCYDAKTGEPVYERQRLLPATAFTASPWAYDGKIFCLSEDGDTFVVQAGKDFKVLGKNPVDEMTLATPALANGGLLIRGSKHLYRIEKK